MRVLIACEFSGVVRSAFRARGHDAWSCDLLPAEDGSEFHLQGDVLKWLNGKPRVISTLKPESWDMLIAHPPCTYLCNSGVRWLAPGGRINRARHKLMVRAADFFARLLAADIPRICVENPTMHGYARDYLQETWRVTRHDASPTQCIQPWQFGHGETKRTCLWLRGLPPLVPTKIVSGRAARVHRESPGPDRWKNRSRTLPAIAEAMAKQWGTL